MGDAYREAQRSVIGSLVIDPGNTLGPVMDTVNPEHFEGEYRTVFEAIRRCWLEQRPVDPVTVAAECGDGYVPLIRECMQLTPTAVNAEIYAKLVRQHSRLLTLRSTGAQLAGAVDEEDARRTLARAEELLSERDRQRVYSIQDLLGSFYMRMSGPKPKYLPWGIRALDEKLTAELGDLVILGADSSVGKTALATQFAWHMAARGYRVGFFSLETNAGKLTSRIVAQRSDLDMGAIKQADYADGDYRKVLELAKAAGGVHLEIVEASGFTAEDIRSCVVARRHQVIFIDYVQLVQGAGKDRPEIVTNASIALHTMAQDLGVTVVALSQITPADKSKKARQAPGKEDLRESRQLIHDADIILMMSLQNAGDPSGLRWLNCAKNKEGELPSVCLKFDPEHMNFTATDSRAWQGSRTGKPARSTFMDLPDNGGQEELPWPT